MYFLKKFFFGVWVAYAALFWHSVIFFSNGRAKKARLFGNAARPAFPAGRYFLNCGDIRQVNGDKSINAAHFKKFIRRYAEIINAYVFQHLLGRLKCPAVAFVNNWCTFHNWVVFKLFVKMPGRRFRPGVVFGV